MQPFALERYFAKHEFRTKYILSASDCEALTQKELLSLADAECGKLWQNLKLSYTETLGHPALLRAIAGLYRTVASDHLLVAAPEELIYIAMRVLLERGDHIVVTTPAYQSLHEIAASIGCTVHSWSLEPTRDGWNLDLQFLKDHVDDATKLIVINFPHNPTGHHISPDIQRNIIEIARTRGIRIFSDEMYRGAEYHAEDMLPAMVDEYEKGISLWGLSKSFALPGLRVGWLATKDEEFLRDCARLRDYLTICNSAPAEILGIIAVREHKKILQRTRDLLMKNLAVADEFFGQHSNSFTWLRPKAGSVAFPALRLPIPVEQFCTNLIDSKNLLITPGSLFQYPGNHFRIGLGRADFTQAVAILGDSLG